MVVEKGDALSLPKGYKQTEIGVIPEDWGSKNLGEITTLLTNGFVGSAKIHYSSSDEDILYIQGYNVQENSFNLNGIKYVTKSFHKKHQKSSLLEDDLLTVQTGDVGLTTIVPKEFEGSNCHALIITRYRNTVGNPKFVSYYLNSNYGRARLKLIETGTTMKHLNCGDMMEFQVPIPPLPEQIAIANTLSDMDALIAQTSNVPFLEPIISKSLGCTLFSWQPFEIFAQTTNQTREEAGKEIWNHKLNGEPLKYIDIIETHFREDYGIKEVEFKALSGILGLKLIYNLPIETKCIEIAEAIIQDNFIFKPTGISGPN